MTDHNVKYLTPALFAPHPGIVAAESTRIGGYSLPPYESLNLGLHTADAPETVSRNRARFFRSLGFSPDQVAGAHQVHGDRIKLVEAPGQYEGYDALITDQPGILLTVTTADCAPVLIFDPVRRAVGAAHAGWRGTVAQIAAKTVAKMGEIFDTSPEDCLVYIGACIDVCCFEVGEEVAAHFTDEQRVWQATTSKYHVNNKAAIRDQLAAAGVLARHIETSPHCTFDHPDYFSHRRDNGVTGRMLAGIALRLL